MSCSSTFRSLRHEAQSVSERAHVPFSETPTGAVLLLSDGQWIPGVRIESASYSLTLPALLNAYTTVVAAGRQSEVVAFVLSRPFRREERVYVEELGEILYEPYADDVWIREGMERDGALPSPTRSLSPVLDRSANSVREGIQFARDVADRAYVPSSNFPVSAIVRLQDHRFVPGVNVEHPDWARILCAERNALGTVLSYGLGPVLDLFLSCADDPAGTPCGACRQLLAELAPDSELWMDRHDEDPEHTTIPDLLPGSFRGRALLDSR